MDRTAWFRAIALTLPPVIALQKMSCFFGGCCYGRRTDLPWGVIFPHRPRHRFYEVPLHPTQIYDAALALSWLLVLTLLDRNKALRPYLFPVFVLLYCVSRFATETLRPEFRRGLATSQIFELVAAAGVLLLLTVGRPLWARFLAGRPEAAA